MIVNNYKSNFNGRNLYIGIVQSRFNQKISYKLLISCLNMLKKIGVQEKNILHISVPGALEIPLTLQNIIKLKKFNVLIAIGVIIRGETYHFELITNNTISSIMKISIKNNIPIINAILTTENIEQANSRILTKGIETAYAAIEIANLISSIKKLH
ncbi:6,7-dimethyl-8-ribityllumazine synthase [Candidatus Profftella armatura (Diaphorina cf. continua)]|uniref:6,7-dimethyl-8-ribityllumazine synthase n=1 Tax=Candidatus Profftella armatura (Diaphorina cf. continua) TaxID=2661583 RepID=A0A7R7AC93_9PROT|nr:6,7-dimethyl-8-ribityllumazine synthase [Candidatus Profftella armatura (Diaphorina cf. continua)]BCG49590.1 6,7-dimethyl-8-ribityllumazine synthase [Candidatus Profftella armatura (Diaphorina cf. continua)]